MQEEDYNQLRNDIKANGFDKSYPIYTYQGEILDGWNRSKVCVELGITPAYAQFNGSDIDAIMFVMRTNKRRNLSSSQKGAIAVEAEELIAAIKEQTEKEAREAMREKKIGNDNAAKEKQQVQLIEPLVFSEENT